MKVPWGYDPIHREGEYDGESTWYAVAWAAVPAVIVIGLIAAFIWR